MSDLKEKSIARFLAFLVANLVARARLAGKLPRSPRAEMAPNLPNRRSERRPRILGHRPAGPSQIVRRAFCTSLLYIRRPDRQIAQKKPRPNLAGYFASAAGAWKIARGEGQPFPVSPFRPSRTSGVVRGPWKSTKRQMHAETFDLDRWRRFYRLVLLGVRLGHDCAAPRQHGRRPCVQPRGAGNLRETRLRRQQRTAVGRRAGLTLGLSVIGDHTCLVPP
jgi:hypothetical protein